MTRRHKNNDDSDDDKGRHNHINCRGSRNTNKLVMLRLGSGGRDGRRRATPLGELETSLGSTMLGLACFALPKPSPEQVKASTDRTLHELFISYTNSMRAALHEFFDEGHPQTATQSPPNKKARGEWLCKAEDYIKATSADQ